MLQDVAEHHEINADTLKSILRTFADRSEKILTTHGKINLLGMVDLQVELGTAIHIV